MNERNCNEANKQNLQKGIPCCGTFLGGLIPSNFNMFYTVESLEFADVQNGKIYISTYIVSQF